MKNKHLKLIHKKSSQVILYLFLDLRFVLNLEGILLKGLTECFRIVLNKVRFGPNLAEYDFWMLAGLFVFVGI